MRSGRAFFREVLVTVSVAILYVACAKIGLALAFRAEQVSAVWPPTGFAIAVLVLLGPRVLPGILIGAFAANATAGEPLWVAAGIAVGNTLEAVVAAAILSRLRFDPAMARLRDVLALFAAIALSPLVSATIGVSFLIAGGLHPSSAAPEIWPVWWLGDALGGLIVAPLILVWSRGDRQQRHQRLEAAAMLTGVVVSCGIVFSLPPAFPAEYVLYPFLIWAGLRLGPAYTTTASLLANAIAVAGTLSGRGPFAGAGPEGGLVLVQVFMAIGAATALILGAVAAESSRAHQRAELSEQRLRLAMAGARVGVWDWNIESGELAWSEGLEPLHGLPHGGFAGTYEAFREFIHPDDRERVEGLIWESVKSGAPYESEFRILGHDGVVRWTSARGVVLADKAGRAARMIGVGIDVTRQKETEEQLQLQHRRKDEFLAMLGHELRNPLAAIVHAIDLLGSDDQSERANALRVVRRQSHSLSRLVDDLLDVSRITRGQITLERRRVSLRDVVHAGVDVWRHLVTARRQRLDIDVPASLWVEGDATRLTQIFANLLHNAAKFSAEEGAISISAQEDAGAVVVRVRDEGQGMAPDLLRHAFELFVQGPFTIDRKQGGLGLGLTLVHRLVEMHGGTVEAHSDGPGLGTELVIRLPLAPAAEAAATPPTSQRELAREPRRVLVVEDNADARDMLVYLLRRNGHEVRAAADGLEALTEAMAFSPEIVLLDLGLPGLDGYAVARELRATPTTSDALIVALTGYGQASDRELTVAAGFDHHLLKPADPAEVLEIVQRRRQASA